MMGNEYEGLLEKRDVRLIRRWAMRAGFQPDEIPDVLQEVAMAVIQNPDGCLAATGAERKLSLWILARDTFSRITRAEQRRRQRDEQKALMVHEAYCDDVTPVRLDVQTIVAGLDEQCRTVCKLLSQGLSQSQIAKRMQCGWHTVDRLVRTIRERFEEHGFEEDQPW